MDAAQKSLKTLRTFQKQIEGIPTNPKDERFVRKFIADIMDDCPVPFLIAVANAVLEARRAELNEYAEKN